MDLNVFRAAYPEFHITHLTLAYNVAQLQHVYKRRFVERTHLIQLMAWLYLGN